MNPFLLPLKRDQIHCNKGTGLPVDKKTFDTSVPCQYFDPAAFSSQPQEQMCLWELQA